MPHAPGTALTLELGEDSDEYHILQAEYMGKLFSRRSFLLKDLKNEEAVVKLINFEVSNRSALLPEVSPYTRTCH